MPYRCPDKAFIKQATYSRPNYHENKHEASEQKMEEQTVQCEIAQKYHDSHTIWVSKFNTAQPQNCKIEVGIIRVREFIWSNQSDKR